MMTVAILPICWGRSFALGRHASGAEAAHLLQRRAMRASFEPPTCLLKWLQNGAWDGAWRGHLAGAGGTIVDPALGQSLGWVGHCMMLYFI